MLSDETCTSKGLCGTKIIQDRLRLSNVWKFIDRVEMLTFSEVNDEFWHGRSLIDSGVLRLFVNKGIEYMIKDQTETITTFGFKSYNNSGRR